MGTRAELEQILVDYLTNDEASFVEHIPDFIRASEERIWFLVQVPKFRKTDTALVCTIDSEQLALPEDYLALASLFVVDSGFQPVDLKDETYLREVFPDQTATARPRVAAQLDDDTVILAPVPDVAYPLQMTYFYKPPSLTTLAEDGETWLSTKAFEVLKYGAMSEAAIYMKKQDEMSATYEEQFITNITMLANLGEVRLRKDVNRGGEKRRQEAS